MFQGLDIFLRAEWDQIFLNMYGMPKITIGITKNLGWDDGIEEPYWGPSYLVVQFSLIVYKREIDITQ